MEFVNPNLHVALVHYPLALLVGGVLIELFSFMWRRHAFRAAGRWMIFLGALSGIPTCLSGIYALHDVANPAHDALTWSQVVAENALNEAQWHMLTDHLIQQSVAIGLALLAVITWIGSSDGWRARLHLPLLGLLLVSVGLTLAGAWHGGELVYRHGTGVVHAGAAPPTDPATHPTTNVFELWQERLEYYLPPMQAHVILAGIAMAIAVAAIGLSIRKITQGPAITQVDHIAAALGPPPTLIGPDGPDDLPEPRDVSVAHIPASRFWMLTCLLAALTAGIGYWILARGFEIWAVKDLWPYVYDSQRRFAHVIAGGSIVVLPIFLAGLARWAPRRKILLTIFILLLLAAVAAQIWFGILLLLDSPNGRIRSFN